MLNADAHPVHRMLEGGRVLRTLSTEVDLVGPQAINAQVHGDAVGALLRTLVVEHPDVEPRDVVWVEEAGRAVATLCAIPWELRLDGVAITALEMGLVATLDGWRRQGLQRLMVHRFRERMRERAALISIIQGIPGFYRQFGYTYSLPLEGGLVLEHRQVPREGHGFQFREATPDDVGLLMGLHDRLQEELALCAVRSEHVWCYLLQGAKGTETECAFWLCEQGGVPVGYIRCPVHHFGEESLIAEAAAYRADVGLALLSHASKVAQETGAPGLRLSLHDGSTLGVLARSLGARDLGRYGWQVMCPDLHALLDALRPALTHRLGRSVWAQFTGDVVIDLYRCVLRLEIVDGSVREVGRGDTATSAHLCAHEDQLLPLVLGYRALGELAAWYPDVIVEARVQPLLEVLFPKLRGFLYPAY